MRMLAVRCFVALAFLVAAAVAFANPFKSKIISGNDSTLVITVPEDHFLKITNFTQDGGTERAVVTVKLGGESESPGREPMCSPRREPTLCRELTRKTLPRLPIESSSPDPQR